MFRNVYIFCILLGLTILLVTSCSSQVKTTTITEKTNDSVSEVVGAYLSSYVEPNISAEALYKIINDDDPGNNPFILSVRCQADYVKGHIPGAINIYWEDVAKEKNLAKLPKDRQIVVYCYTGHTGSQITALLNILGYDAINLKFGMSSWTLDGDVAPGRYNESSNCMDYPFVTGS